MLIFREIPFIKPPRLLCAFCGFVKGFPPKFAYCVSVLSVRLNLYVFGSCFRMLAVILFQMFLSSKFCHVGFVVMQGLPGWLDFYNTIIYNIGQAGLDKALMGKNLY